MTLSIERADSRSVIASDLLQHDYLRTEADPPIQIHNVLIVHADAPVRHKPANRSRVVGAVNSVFAFAKSQRGGTHRISGTAPRYKVGQRWLIALYLERR